MMRSMLRGLVAFVFLLMSASSASGQLPVPPPPAPGVGMASGILIDIQTGKILWSKDDRVVRPPASLTKILTALVVLENANLKDKGVLTKEARYAPGGRMYAEEGWTFTIEDLLWGLLLQSGNDAAVALAQAVSPDGTIDGFSKLMNDRAHELGAIDTNFANPHGYDQEGHLTTARDLGIITLAAMKNPTFAKMVMTKTHDITWGDGSPHTLINHNKLLTRYPGTVGVKTGFTNGAGHSLVSAVTRDGSTLIAVAMGSPDHYGESIALYDWGFGNLAALRTQSTTSIRAVKKTRTVQAPPADLNGLEVVQVGQDLASGTDAPQSPASAPLVAPLLALLAAGGLGSMMSKRRRRRQSYLKVMGDLHTELDALHEPEPSRVGV